MAAEAQVARADVPLLLLAAAEAPLRRLGKRGEASPAPRPRRPRSLPQLGLGRADLRRTFHIIAPDLRGHGDSQWAIGSTYSMIDYVLDVAALLEDLDLFPITIIAHSLGALGRAPVRGHLSRPGGEAGRHRGARAAGRGCPSRPPAVDAHAAVGRRDAVARPPPPAAAMRRSTRRSRACARRTRT